MLSSLQRGDQLKIPGFCLHNSKDNWCSPEGGALVDKETAGADVALGWCERRVLSQLLLQRAEDRLLQLSDLLQVSQTISICVRECHEAYGSSLQYNVELTVLQQDEGRVERENLLGQFHLCDLASELKDLVDQGHLLRDVGGEEGANGKHHVVEEDRVVGQVKVATHPDDRQLETP